MKFRFSFVSFCLGVLAETVAATLFFFARAEGLNYPEEIRQYAGSLALLTVEALLLLVAVVLAVRYFRSSR